MNTTPTTQPTQLSPAQISAMLQARRERAKTEALNYGLFRQPNGVWSVVSRDGKRVYETTQFACSCPDFARLGKELGACKHVFLIRTEEERLAEDSRERAARVKRNRDEDFGPSDEYDGKPTTYTDPFGPLPDPAPERRFWEDARQAAEYADWLEAQMERGEYPAD